MGIMHYAIIQHFKRQREMGRMGRTGRARRNGRGNVWDGVSKASRAANLTSRATEQLTGRGGLAGRAEEQAGGRNFSLTVKALSISE